MRSRLRWRSLTQPFCQPLKHRCNSFNTQIAIFKLIRTIKLFFWGGDSPIPSQGIIIRTSRSTFVPLITAFEKMVQRDIKLMECSSNVCWNNLHKEEKIALKNLTKDTSIVIKEADKGGGIVILDRDVYNQEVERQIMDQEFCREVQQDPSKSIQKLIQTVLIEGTTLGCITEDMANMLTKERYRVPLFYILPKIHKPGSPPQGRLIVSRFHSAGTSFSTIRCLFTTIVLHSPLYIKDTKDLINKMERKQIPETVVWATLDVSTLYTSIPHAEAYHVVANTLDKQENPYSPTIFYSIY